MRLSIQHLGKVYQDGNEALIDFNLDLDNGVFGLLGPNGAGKSTLLEILSLNLMPTTGQVFWEGEDVQKNPRALRRVLGYLPQTYGFYDELKVAQFLEYMGKLSNVYGGRLSSRIDECLELVHLGELRNRKIKTFSGGMKQRLAIASALLASPALLIIDEPTTGLDPSERVAFRNMLFDLGRSCVVILSTHIVKDVEFSCHEMTLLYGGMQRFTGRPVDFIQSVESNVFEVEVAVGDFEPFAAEHHVVAIHERGEAIDVRFIEADGLAQVAGRRPVRPNLEDAYISFIRGLVKEEELVGQAG